MAGQKAKKKFKRIVFTADAGLAVKAADTTSPDSCGKLVGYAMKWNTLSTDRGGYKVRLMPGSAQFADTTHALYHHELTGGPLGDTQSKTLKIEPDDQGVKVSIDLPNTTLGKDVYELVRTGRIAGMSFAMTEEPQFFASKEDGQKIQNCTKFTVDDVTVTAIPAFTDTSIGVVNEDADDEEDAEETQQASATQSVPLSHAIAQKLTLEKLNLEMLKLA
jgi:uncharacterized protein